MVNEPLQGGNAAPAERLLAPLSAVEGRAVEWLWTGMLARGMLALLAGEVGAGKSTLATLIAAILSRGADWPDGDFGGDPIKVVWYTGEEDLRCTVRPRFDAHGANIGNVSILREDFRPFEPKHVEALAQACPDVGLIVLDPITSIVANSREANNPIEIRKCLKPWTNLAEKTGAAILGITHFSKASGDRKALDRVLGSVSWTGVARVVLIATEIHDSTDRAVIRAKSNIGPTGDGWRYTITQAVLPNPAASEPTQPANIRVPRAAFGERLEGRPDALMHRLTTPPRQKRPTKTADAKDILFRLGRDDKAFRAGLAYDAAGKAGIGRETMRKAISDLGWTTRKLNDVWLIVPATAPEPCEEAA